MTATVQGESWDLSTEYAAIDAPAIDRDLKAIAALLDELEGVNPVMVAALPHAATLTVAEAGEAINAARQAHQLGESLSTLLDNVSTYVHCRLSVDSDDADARVLQGKLLGLRTRAAEAAQVSSQFIQMAVDPVVDAYLDDEAVRAASFSVRHSRERRHENLSLAEETLVTALGQDGIHAWGRMYDQIAGSLQCDVVVDNEVQRLGLAEASAHMQRPQDAVRERAWRGINAAWAENTEACSAAINAIAGWRLELARKRSTTQPVHFLDAPAHMNRIQRTTLDTIMAVARDTRPLAQRAARLMARAYGKARLGPWDNRAPAPQLPGGEESPLPYEQAVDLIAKAYGGVDPTMAEFVRMMATSRWIEGTVGPRKQPGAYCTGFAKSRTPRVYMTYTGSSSDVITLAHELGHAFHSWVMRDLPDSQRSYGMSLAETASTFGETVVRDALLSVASTPQEKLDIVWEEMAALVAFLLNIPTRFEFEKNFYEARAERPLRPDELNAMMADAWRAWYGDALSEPDEMFWANKLHFFISELSFYNFPYLFGYLFSLGVYARRDVLGASFFPRYRELLRDTGRMTAEDLARQHLEADISEPEFWQGTIRLLETRVDVFESLLDEIGV